MSNETYCPPGRIQVMLTDTSHFMPQLVPPGDTRNLDYRFATFQQFPHNRVNINTLVRKGFYYLGIKDRVCCAFCKILIQDWTMNDTPSSPLFHKANCEMRNSDQSNRRITRSSSRRPVNLLIPTIPATRLEQLFPCNRPANILFKRLWDRIVSFHASLACNWQQRLRASTVQMAEAGFFEIGHEDTVQCFYCGGTLFHWQYNDIPLLEHAKFFPTCHYLLRMAGPAYVIRVTEQYPNVRRPHVIGNNPITDIYEQILQHII